MAGDLATVAVVYSQPECAVVTSLLRAHGFYCFTMPGHHAAAAWWHVTALGGIEIRVFNDDLPAARALLSDAVVEEIGPPRLAFSDSPVVNALIALSLYAIAVPPPARQPIVLARVPEEQA